MSIELSNTVEVQELWQAITSGRVSYLTYAALQAAISRPFGSIAEVQGDAGTHTDPVSALVVSNSGVFRRVDAGWERLSDTPADVIANLVLSGGSGQVGHIADPAFTGEVARTVQAKLRESWVSPEDFGAVGDGTANDTTPLQNAAATGKHVRLTPGKTYHHTADITLNTNYQEFGGPGVLKPVGNCGVIVTGNAVGIQLELTFNSATHTGTAVKIANAHRTVIKRLLAVDCFTFLDVRQANAAMLIFGWGSCRGSGIKWFGNDSLRSDLLTITSCTLAIAAGQYGLDWDGNCHSLEIKQLEIVCGSSVGAGNAKGVIIRNTSGGATLPAIGRFHNVKVDYATGHGIEIAVQATGLDFIGCYSNGCNLSGIYIGAAVNSYEVRILGGEFHGNSRYGIESASAGVVLYDGAAAVYNNTLGDVLGTVRCLSPSFSVDANSQYTLSAGNPQLILDANDYISYDRAANAGLGIVGGAEKWRWDAIGLKANRFYLDATAYWELSSSNPQSIYDATDYTVYDRASNVLLTYIGGAEATRIDSVGLRAPRLRAADDNLYIGISGSSAQMVFDTNDYLNYDRTANQLRMLIGGTAVISAIATGFGFAVGQGGAVTQITSRSTGVTLNKACGAITLVSAAGSAAWTTFTVTNSAVGVNDIIRCHQKSGTDRYMVHVTKVQAGSFDVTFATTGGTTTEQPVFTFGVTKGEVT